MRHYAKYVYEDYIEGWHTQVLCDALDLVEKGEIRFLLIEAPPRHSKSLHVSQLFPSHVVGNDPDKSVKIGFIVDGSRGSGITHFVQTFDAFS